MEHVSTGSTVAVDLYPRMSWGAIFAGWAIATAVATLLFLGGLALGFSAFDANDAAATSKGIGIGTAIWVVLTWAASLFVGAMYASWFDGKDDETMGTMHGVAVWGLSVVVSGVLAIFGAGNLAGTGASVLGGSASALLTTSSANSSSTQVHQIMDSASQLLGARLNKGIRDSSNAVATSAAADSASGGGQDVTAAQAAASVRSQGNGTMRPLDSAASAAVAAALLRGDNQSAQQILAADTDLSPTQLNALIQAQAAQIEQVKAKAKAAANQVAKYTAMAMWIAFVSLLAGLLASALGGWLGSSRVHRVYHLRTYRRSTPV